MPRKIGELELDFENPTWKSNWDFEEFTVEFTVNFTVRFTTNFIIENASARPSHPQIAGPADRGAQSVLGVYA